MTVHLLKLCVGVDSIGELVRHRAMLAGRKKRAGVLEDEHRTRSFPRRSGEVLDGGSLYWVIRGQICVRHRILRLDEVEGVDGRQCCAIVYDPTVIITEMRPRRAFQGWRYLEAEDAPPDLPDQGRALMRAVSDEGIPAKLREELRFLGLI